MPRITGPKGFIKERDHQQVRLGPTETWR